MNAEARTDDLAADEKDDLIRSTPDRVASASELPLNDTCALLGTLAASHILQAEAAARMSSRTAPDIHVT